MGFVIDTRVLVAGEAEGELLAASEPLSFWGGYSQTTGEIIDRRHPLSGQMAAGRILALPGSRGSSTTTAVLLEALRNGNAPAAILTIGVDNFLALASIVAEEMFGRAIPLAAVTPEEFEQLRSGDPAHLARDGRLLVG